MTILDWWHINVDKGKCEAAFVAAGLPLPNWVNREPVFEGKVDLKKVNEIVAGVIAGKIIPPIAPKPKKKRK